MDAMNGQKRFLLVLLLVVAGSGILAPPAHAAHTEPVKAVRDLWIDVSLGPPLVEWFNQVARPDDVARDDHIERQVSLLETVTAGRKLVVFTSVTEAEERLPEMAETIDIIGYNPEHRPATPLDEQADPIGSVQRMRALADRYDLPLAVGPDHDFAVEYGVDMAPYVDIFVLQVQRVQTEPATVRNFVLPLARRLRMANRNLQISVQVRTEGDVTALVDLIDSLKHTLDGVSILTSPDTVDIAKALVAELRTRTPPATPTPMTTVEPTGRPDSRVTATPAPRRDTPDVRAAAPEVTPASDSLDSAGELITPQPDRRPQWLFTILGALFAGAIGGGLVGAFIMRTFKRWR